MIRKFVSVYPGHIDLPDMGQNATPANDRNFSNDQLAGIFEKTEAVAKQMDKFGWDTLWLAEHHFQFEGYEVLPTLEHFMQTGAWSAGTPDGLIEHVKTLEARYPGMQHISLSTSMGTPKSVMLEQFQWVAEAVMPAFNIQRAPAA